MHKSVKQTQTKENTMVFQDQLLKMKKGYGRNMKNEKRVEWEKEQKEFEEYLKERENSAATIEK